MSVFDLAMKAANQSQKLARGVSSNIVVSDVLTLSDVVIVPAETTRQAVDGDVIIEERLQDWLVLVDDCDGNIPNLNWQIVVGSDTFSIVENDTLYKFHDAPVNSVYRIHTRLIIGASG